MEPLRHCHYKAKTRYLQTERGNVNYIFSQLKGERLNRMECLDEEHNSRIHTAMESACINWQNVPTA